MTPFNQFDKIEILSVDPMIFQIDHFFDLKKLENIIEAIPDKDMKHAGIVGPQRKSQDRVALTKAIKPEASQEVNQLREKVTSIVNLEANFSETPRLLRYNVGGEFKAHQDSAPMTSMPNLGVFRKAGPRFYTAILYMNDNFEGGETQFPRIPTTVSPKAGRLLFWANTALDSPNPHPKSLHSGLPVRKGQKNILSFWLHSPVGTRMMSPEVEQ